MGEAHKDLQQIETERIARDKACPSLNSFSESNKNCNTISSQFCDNLIPLPTTQTSEISVLTNASEVKDTVGTLIQSASGYARTLQEELEEDIRKGLLISNDQYNHLRYESVKIQELRNAKNFKELFQLAEQIILDDRSELESFGEAEIESIDEEKL